MPRTGFALRYRDFRLPRRGASLDECQDAAAANPGHGRFAIADGASESYSPGLWAKLLVETFVVSESRTELSSWLAALRQKWDSLVEAERGPTPPPMPWYLEGQYRQGAFATFLGLSLQENHGKDEGGRMKDEADGYADSSFILPPSSFSGWHWHALAVGDSCLFHVREGRLLESFPLQRSDEFGSMPWLVGSRATAQATRDGTEEVVQSQGLTRSGEVLPQDRLWLMTDALAQWFLRQAETGARPWEEMDRLMAAGPGADDEFAAWIEDLRTRRQLRNDDVTLMAVCLE
jgi:hypothetical protein